MNIYTLVYGTFTFPNQTFEVKNFSLPIDTPVTPIRRKDGGVSLDGYLSPRKFVIRGKVYSEDEGTALENLRTMQRALHNRGQSAAFYYQADRYFMCRLAPEGVNAIPNEGLWGHVFDVDAVLVAEKPYAESTTLRTTTGSRTNNSSAQSLTNNGNAPTNPIFTFVAGTWAFSSDLRVENVNNSLFFSWGGRFAAGQTLVIDCDAGCVLLHVGATMVDAISYFSGNLFFKLEDGGNNTVVIDAATLSYTITSRDRYYA